MTAPKIRMAKNRSGPRKRQLTSAEPFTAATAIDWIVAGTTIRTEFQKPRDSPSQFSPVQACDHALTQGSKVISTAGAKMWPMRISGMPFSEGTTITHSGNR